MEVSNKYGTVMYGQGWIIKADVNNQIVSEGKVEDLLYEVQLCRIDFRS